jgi:predicted transcriptional regulator
MGVTKTNERTKKERVAIIPEHVFKRCASMPTSVLAVYAALSLHSNGRGKKVWPSIARLARLTGASKSTVRKALTKLVNAGLIVRSVRKRTSSVYGFAIE